MDDAVLHILRNLLLTVLRREEPPFVDTGNPPTVEVEGPLASGGGIIPAVGGTIVERPSLDISAFGSDIQPPKLRDIEPKVDVDVEVVGDEIIVHKGKIVNRFGEEIEIEEQKLQIPTDPLFSYLVYRNGKIEWSINVLPSDIPLFTREG